VRAEGFHISTGFVGTPLICDALSNTGAQRAAYRLLLQRECPSWLYPVTMGATTVWERWDSMLPDGSINPGEMTSFNHYALGAVADWLHRVVAGLAPAEPGYRRLHIRPRPGGGLTSARATHKTPYGTAECAWRIADGELELTLVVPPNSGATVELPGSDETAFDVGPGTHSWRYRYETPDARRLTARLGAGGTRTQSRCPRQPLHRRHAAHTEPRIAAPGARRRTPGGRRNQRDRSGTGAGVGLQGELCSP
jgi:alpha-L-rhamnosidase